MKVCFNCKISKDNDFFCKSSRNKDGLQSWCKSCVSAARMKRYYDNRETERENGNRRNREAVARNRKLIWNYLKTHPCVDCGESDPIVLEFDHIDPKTKINSISNLAKQYHAWDSIQLEIEKCQVRCANCHRKRTAKQFNWYKNIPE